MEKEQPGVVAPSDKVLERRVEAFQRSTEKLAERARGLLQYLSDVATERGVFPYANFVNPPDKFSNRTVRGNSEPAMFVDVEYGAKNHKQFIVLKEGAELIRYNDRRTRPNGGLIYDADGAEKLSDIEYPLWANIAAIQLLYFIRRGKKPKSRS